MRRYLQRRSVHFSCVGPYTHLQVRLCGKKVVRSLVQYTGERSVTVSDKESTVTYARTKGWSSRGAFLLFASSFFDPRPLGHLGRSLIEVLLQRHSYSGFQTQLPFPSKSVISQRLFCMHPMYVRLESRNCRYRVPLLLQSHLW